MITTEWMIDVTSMKRILSELDFGQKITGVWDVKDENLSDIADCCVEDTTQEMLDKFFNKVKEDKIIFYECSSDSKIPLTNAVNCIRLEPFYFVKDLHKPFI